jgi:hypothetical protein
MLYIRIFSYTDNLGMNWRETIRHFVVSGWRMNGMMPDINMKRPGVPGLSS